MQTAGHKPTQGAKRLPLLMPLALQPSHTLPLQSNLHRHIAGTTSTSSLAELRVERLPWPKSSLPTSTLPHPAESSWPLLMPLSSAIVPLWTLPALVLTMSI
jgi:hypothetical protein